MFRIKIDEKGKYGRYFRPVAAGLVIVLAMAFALREGFSPERDELAIFALLAVAAVGLVALLRRP